MFIWYISNERLNAAMKWAKPNKMFYFPHKSFLNPTKRKLFNSVAIKQKPKDDWINSYSSDLSHELAGEKYLQQVKVIWYIYFPK